MGGNLSYWINQTIFLLRKYILTCSFVSYHIFLFQTYFSFKIRALKEMNFIYLIYDFQLPKDIDKDFDGKINYGGGCINAEISICV